MVNSARVRLTMGLFNSMNLSIKTHSHSCWCTISLSQNMPRKFGFEWNVLQVGGVHWETKSSNFGISTVYFIPADKQHILIF